MPASSYAVWVLALQTAAYVGYLDFGLQTAVGRYVAYANEKQDTDGRDAAFSTAFAGLTIAALLGIPLVAILAFNAHAIFPAIPAALIPSLQLTIVIVGVSTAIGLPASACSGVFVGMQRYELPALAIGSAKLVSAAGLIAAALLHQSIVTMALILAGANLLSYALQFIMVRRFAPQVRFHAHLITRQVMREYLGYCSSLTVWSFAMLLVGGFDLLLVGRFQFSSVTPYAISLTMITLLAGVQNAVFSVIMPHAAGLQAREDAQGLGNLLIRTTRVGVLLLILTGLPLMVFAKPIISIWIGPAYGDAGQPLLVFLVIANILRLIGAPYASILIGTGKQRLILVSPVAEGVSNFIASVVLGIRFGAIGVAWGTLIGAAIGMICTIAYNVAKTSDTIAASRRRYALAGIAIPSLAFVPVLLAEVFARFRPRFASAAEMLALTLSLGLSLFMLLRSFPQGVRI
jgi:O-antigen/teichoic acid export membrane protein